MPNNQHKRVSTNVRNTAYGVPDRRRRRGDRAPSPHAGGWHDASWSFWILCGFFVLCAVGGGSSKIPTLSLLYLRPVAVLCLGAIALTGGVRNFSRYRVPFLILAALAVAIGLQLVPLPPSWSAGLPGHGAFATAARLTGDGATWHPISLTPDLTINSMLALLPALVVLVAFTAMNDADRERSVLIIPLVALASMAFAVVQLGQGPDSPAYMYAAISRDLPVGLFGNRNHQAALLAIAIPAFAGIAVMLTIQRGRPLVFFGLAGALGVLCILFGLLTGSRSGLALLGVGALGAVAIAWPVIPRRRYRAFVVVGMAVGLAAAIGLAIGQGRATAVERLTADNGLTGEMRVRAFTVLMQLTRDYAPWGSGFGSFDPVFRNAEPDALLKQSFFNNAHNDFIELAITGGLPALAVLALASIWFGGRGWHAWRSPTPSSDVVTLEALPMRLGWLALSIVALASLSDYPARTPLFAAIIALAGAWLCPRPVNRGVVDHGLVDDGVIRRNGDAKPCLSPRKTSDRTP